MYPTCITLKNSLKKSDTFYNIVQTINVQNLLSESYMLVQVPMTGFRPSQFSTCREPQIVLTLVGVNRQIKISSASQGKSSTHAHLT